MSNQVYSNQQNAIPYNSPPYATQFLLTGNVGGITGFIGVQLYRINPGQGMLAITGSQVGVQWNGATILSAPGLTIPDGFRPSVDQYMTMYITTGSVQKLCRILIASNGGIQVARPDLNGNAQLIANNEQIVPCTFVYPVG